MSGLLPRFLAMSVAGPQEYRELAEGIPANITVRDEKGKIVRMREYLQSTKLASTALVQTEMYKTVIQGADPLKCWENAAMVVPMTQGTLDVPYGESGTYAPEVGEGAQIAEEEQAYSKATITAKKYAVRPAITREAIDDGLWSIVEQEVYKAGQRVMNSINQQALNAFLDSSNQEKDTAGSDQGIKAVASAMAILKKLGYQPDTLVASPEMMAMLIKEFVPGYFEKKDLMETGTFAGRVLGLNVYECGVANKTGGTYTWAYAADSNIGALVFAKGYAGAIGMRENITIEQYSDPIRDLIGMKVKARMGAAVFNGGNAIARIEY